MQVDAGAQAGKLLHMHEAVFENRLGDARGALGARTYLSRLSGNAIER
jgi:hypothetical protein